MPADGGTMGGLTANGLELVLAGGVGAVTIVALLLFTAYRRDQVPLWLGLFCLALTVHFLLDRGSALDVPAAFLAGPCLVMYAGALYPGAWQRRVGMAAIAFGVLAALAAVAAPAARAPALAAMQLFALGAVAMALAATLHVMRERHSAVPLAIAGIALGYLLLLWGLAPVEAELIAFVFLPAVAMARRFSRAFDAETRRSLDQAKLTGDLFESIPVGLAMRDSGGRYLFVNRTWETYFGLKREAVLGTTPYARASSNAEKTLALDRAAIARGPAAPPDLQDVEYRGKRFMQSRTVLADSQGKLVGVLIATIDATERYAMEQALATEQRRFALVVRAGQVGILDWDGVNRSVYYSQRFKEMLGYAPEADSSSWPDYFDMIHAEDRGRVKAQFRTHVLGEGPEGAQEIHEQNQYRLRRADGSWLWVEGVGISERDAKGFVRRFIGSVTDISARRAYEEALRESMRLREEVERMSRHDLKTPLNSIIAVPRLLREGRKLTSEEHQLLSIIERAGYRILNMVNLSLDLFRMESGSYSFRPLAVDLDDLLRKVIADLESHADSKDLVVRTVRVPGAGAAPGIPITARGEELLCYSLLANLLKNAIEASPEGGTVTVTLAQGRDAKQGVTIDIHNAGAVPEAVRESFFHKYSSAGKAGGLGLGTYSARLMARVQQGDIAMRSSAEEGTTLSVRLAEAPADAAAATPGAPSAGDRGAARLPQLPPLAVLVVDDDEFNRLVLRRFLPEPLAVETAVNGRAALEVLRRQPFDFVFLDLEMPVMNGYDAAERIRLLERELGRKPATLVAFSQNDDEDSIRRALAAGCDHYLTKPAPRETLWKLLAGHPVATGKKPEQEAAFSDPVEVDADLRPTIAAFYVSRRKVLDQVEAALAAGERGAVKELSHTLAGSFSLYGFKWAAARCRALQRAALEGEPGALAEELAAVRRHLDCAELRFVESAPA